MPLRVGLVTAAHLHVWAYVHALQAHEEAELVGIWDHDAERAEAFGTKAGLPVLPTYEALLNLCDAVVIVSENKLHGRLGLQAIHAGKHVLCEKPLVTDLAEGEALIAAAADAGVKLMTAFPCRFAPSYGILKQKISDGEIGQVQAICATNRGRCPFGWFVETDLSGGGAMIDHVVHVADLLRDLLGEEPVRVQAQTGNNMYGETWEDTAMLTIEFPGGIFATLDSSWSRPKNYRTWGDVNLTVVGEKGVIELDMFGTEVQQYGFDDVTHVSAGVGTDLDSLMVADFVSACVHGTPLKVDGRDGLEAARVALAGYESVRAQVTASMP